MAIAIISIFSTTALAKSIPAHSKKKRVIVRGVVETPPKRKVGVQKHFAPLQEKSVARVAKTHQPKAKTVAKKKAERSFFWKMATNRFAMMIWVPLLLMLIVILIRFYQLFPRREMEVSPESVKEEVSNEKEDWLRRDWEKIKKFFCRGNKQPAIATC